MSAAEDRIHLQVAGPAEAAADGPCATLLRVGDLAKVTGKTVRALHHYEELGLLEPAARSKGHYRLYHPETTARIRWITKLTSVGISLGEIQALVQRRRDCGSAQQSAEELRKTYSAMRQAVSQRLAELEALRDELDRSLQYLGDCSRSCTPPQSPSDCSQCERLTQHPPFDLIAGAMC